MKFLTKINRNYLMLFFLVLLAVTITGYFILRAIILHGTKDHLISKEYLIEKQIRQTGEIPNLNPIFNVQKTDERTISKPSFKEITIRNKLENEDEVFLEYSNKIKIDNSYYLIKLRQYEFENEDMIMALVATLFILVFAAFIISFFITKKMNKTVWADFEHNLQEIENFSFSSNKDILLRNSDIEELDRLNRKVTNLTEKLKTDYLSLKEFTENASHEIQTPLSIVLLNLEEVLQQEITAETFQKVVSSINALKRLSVLNQSLILLTKIGNRQFEANKILNINDLVKKSLQEFEPLFEVKKIKIELISKNNFEIFINEQLAEIMINNLLSNAVKHNMTGGSIKISILEKELIFCNTGVTNSLTNETVFNRFTKGNSKSFGLGLAIVKNICDTHNLEIRYQKNELHCFIINQKI